MSSQLNTALAHEESKLLACVHCGLCLEACPTYVHTGDENDGPRGRIYLMRAVEEGRLPATASTFERHINRCLGCRACESACPAGVEYGQLLEAARADLQRVRVRTGWTNRLLRFALRHVWLHPARLRLAFSATRCARDLRLAKLLRATKLPRLLAPRFDFALALLAGSAAISLTERATPAPAHTQPPVVAANDGRALLFAGCVMEGLFARVNLATTRVLAVNGCQTERPRGQVCCGALHAHAGDLVGARQLARQNIEAFADEQAAPVVTNAGGCGAMLAAYGQLLADDPQYADRARRFSARVRDISQQLQATGLRTGARISAPATTYDASCHLLHGQHATTEPLALLSAIPDLVFAPLAGSDVCCGGAGVYNMLEPELAARVLTEKLKHVAATGATLVATGNPGCHMQISAGAQLRGLPLRVCHPVELLD
ncbi:MAG TPA: heterodisulfide reductase-related iron-sulfur binding cluster, partial [Pyrinomonadaceae bacterium]|nr:heterodisulfide reductase-related iron-sulfur binding cluster [Pyrinomonadaceae bacterium]